MRFAGAFVRFDFSGKNVCFREKCMFDPTFFINWKYDCVIKTAVIFNFLPLINIPVTIDLGLFEYAIKASWSFRFWRLFL